jgi:hypothetical protein
MRRLRLWRLVKLTGWSRQDILDAPAVELDWLLGIEDAAAAAQDAKNKRSQPGAGRRERGPR